MHSPATLLSGGPRLESEIFDHHWLNVYLIPNVSKNLVVFFASSSPKLISIQMNAGFKGCLFVDFNKNGAIQGDN